MRILVTGCAGLIGSHLVDNLIESGYEVVGIDNLSYGSLNNLCNVINSKNFKFVEGDVKKISEIFDKYTFDLVYHLSTMKKPTEGIIKSSLVIDENFTMSKEVVNFCIKKNIYLIFASTSDIYGNSDSFLESEKITIGPPTNERYSYAMSKFISEQYIFNETNQSGLKASVVRIFGCASERSKPSWSAGHVPLFIYNALNNIDINIHGDGLQTRSISSAKDIAFGLSNMSFNLDKVNQEIINLGTNEQTTVREVAEYIVSKTNSKSRIKYIPREDIFGDYDEILIRFANTDKAKLLIGFRIKFKTYDVIDSIIEEYGNKNSKYYCAGR